MTRYSGSGMMAGVGVYVASGFSGSSLWGALHPGFGRRDSDVGVKMGTVDICGPVWLHVSCELGPPCKVKLDRFAVSLG